MDVSNLHYPLLLEYLCDSGYSRRHTEQQMRALATLEDEVASTTPKKWKLEKNKGLSDIFGFTRP